MQKAGKAFDFDFDLLNYAELEVKMRQGLVVANK
jgi:hypothetical protein